MRRLPILIVLISLFATAWPGSKRNVQATQAGSKPKRVISSMVIEKATFQEKDGKAVEMPRRKFVEATFDAKGNLIESKVFFPKDDLFRRYVATWNESGNKIEDAYFNGDGNLIGKQAYTYDSGGKLAEILVFEDKKEPVKHITFKRDSSGRIIERSVLDPKKNVISRTTHSYSDEKRIIQNREFDEKNLPVSASADKLDDKGRAIVSQSFFRPDARYKENTLQRGFLDESTYDASGNFIEGTLTFGPIVGKEKHVYERNTEGDWVSKRSEKLVQTPSGERYQPFETTYRTITYGKEADPPKKVDDQLGYFVEDNYLDYFLPGERKERRLPDYPPTAKRAGISGHVLVPVKFSELGRAVFSFSKPIGGSSKEVADYEPLVKAARESALLWTFSPSLVNGKPVSITWEVTFLFNGPSR